MTTRLHPCAATVICGPCLPCPEFTDLSRTSPDARVVYAKNDAAVSMVDGAVTYEDGGPPVVVGMTVVTSTQKLCLGRNQSVDGPLVYVTGIPLTATITDVVYTYNDGVDDIETGGEVVASCTNYLAQILRVTGDLDCDATPTVTTLAGSCAPCTENTGTYTVASGSLITTKTVYANSTCTLITPSCVNTTATGSVNWQNLSLAPPSFTPTAGNRPCNWIDVAFTVTLDSSYTYSGTNTPSAGITSCPVTYTKTAGSNTVTVSSSAGNCVRSGCVSGYDRLVRTGYITASSSPGEFDIPCTGYKLRQRHSSGVNDGCVGGNREVPDVSYIAVDLMPK